MPSRNRITRLTPDWNSVSHLHSGWIEPPAEDGLMKSSADPRTHAIRKRRFGNPKLETPNETSTPNIPEICWRCRCRARVFTRRSGPDLSLAPDHYGGALPSGWGHGRDR